MTEITPQESKIYKELFTSLDYGKKNVINADQVGYALRSINQCPSERDIAEIVTTYTDEDTKPGEIPKINFEDFCVIMKENTRTKEDLNTRLIEAFALYDPKDTGLIDEVDLRNGLKTLGEVMEDAEINEFMKDAKTGSDGKIPYTDFINVLLDSYARPQSKKASAKKGGASAKSKSPGGKKKKK